MTSTVDVSISCYHIHFLIYLNLSIAKTYHVVRSCRGQYACDFTLLPPLYNPMHMQRMYTHSYIYSLQPSL